jgi:hypothetical protein
MSRLPLRVALRIAPIEIRTRATAHALRVYRRDPFLLDGERYRYLFHHYNTTWRNERTVEVPIAIRMLQRHIGARVLEVGNVLHWYSRAVQGTAGREIVDKYEVAPRVRNIDIADYVPEMRYGAIVTLSTMEHVGWDEERRDPGKAASVIERMHGWLEPGGELLATIPLGYHAELDRRLLDGPQLFEHVSFMRRRSADNRWVQAPPGEVRGARYGSPFPFANALAVGRSSA